MALCQQCNGCDSYYFKNKQGDLIMNYLVLDGKQIGISDETAVEIKKAFVKKDEADEFLEMWQRKYDFNSSTFKPHIEIVDGERIMYIKIPECNTTFAKALFQTCIDFCYHARCLCFISRYAKVGYISISLGEE